jgi:hypothetical protein
MKEATLLHNNIIRTTLRETKGYEVILREMNATSAEGICHNHHSNTLFI